MKIYSINNKQYAIGLWWQMQEIQSTSKLRKRAKSLSESIVDENYNRFVVYNDKQHGASFLGIGEDKENIRKKSQKLKNKKIQSLTLALMTSLSLRKWLLKVTFDEGVWITGINDGLLLLEGDFFGDAQEAEKLFNNFYQLNDEWENVFIFNSEKEFQNWVSDILVPKNIFYLKPIPFQIPIKQIIVAILIVMLIKSGFMGMAWWKSYQQKKRMAIFLHRQKQLLEQNSKQVFSKIWLSKIYPAQQMQKWESIIFNHFTKDEKGWQLHKIECFPNQVVITKQKLPYGRFNCLPDHAKFNFKKPNLVTITETLTADKTSRIPMPLLTQTEFAQKIYETTRILSAKLHVKWGSVITKVIKKKTFIAPYRKISWTISDIKVFPKDIIARIINTQGLILTNLVFKKKLWTIKGVTYVQK